MEPDFPRLVESIAAANAEVARIPNIPALNIGAILHQMQHRLEQIQHRLDQIQHNLTGENDLGQPTMHQQVTSIQQQLAELERLFLIRIRNAGNSAAAPVRFPAAALAINPNLPNMVSSIGKLMTLNHNECLVVETALGLAHQVLGLVPRRQRIIDYLGANLEAV